VLATDAHCGLWTIGDGEKFSLDFSFYRMGLAGNYSRCVGLRLLAASERGHALQTASKAKLLAPGPCGVLVTSSRELAESHGDISLLGGPLERFLPFATRSTPDRLPLRDPQLRHRVPRGPPREHLPDKRQRLPERFQPRPGARPLTTLAGRRLHRFASRGPQARAVLAHHVRPDRPVSEGKDATQLQAALIEEPPLPPVREAEYPRFTPRVG